MESNRRKTKIPIAPKLILVFPKREDLDMLEGSLRGGVYICPSCDCVCQCNCI